MHDRDWTRLDLVESYNLQYGWSRVVHDRDWTRLDMVESYNLQYGWSRVLHDYGSYVVKASFFLAIRPQQINLLCLIHFPHAILTKLSPTQKHSAFPIVLNSHQLFRQTSLLCNTGPDYWVCDCSLNVGTAGGEGGGGGFVYFLAPPRFDFHVLI